MKKFIIKLFRLQALLDQAYQRGLREGEAKADKYHSDKFHKRDMINYPVGSDVMLIFNVPHEILLAEIVRYENFPSGQLIPVFRFANGEESPSFGKILHYNENRFKTLSKLTWWERWNAVTDFAASFNEQTAKNISENRPAWQNE